MKREKLSNMLDSQSYHLKLCLIKFKLNILISVLKTIFFYFLFVACAFFGFKTIKKLSELNNRKMTLSTILLIK